MAEGKKKPIGKIILALLVVVVVAVAGGGNSADSSSGATVSRDEGPGSASVESAVSEPELEPEPDVPTEYISALKKAETYSDMMHMSKQGIYDQLVSEYGEQFSPEAAQYAIDNLQADYNANALEKAKVYQDDMHMSPEAIRDQLVSEYGEKFTQEEADYAVANLG